MEKEPALEQFENDPDQTEKIDGEAGYLGDVSFKFLTIRNTLMTLPREVFEIETVQEMFCQSTRLRDMFNNIGRGNIRNKYKSSFSRPDHEDG